MSRERSPAGRRGQFGVLRRLVIVAIAAISMIGILAGPASASQNCTGQVASETSRVVGSAGSSVRCQ